jgi:predicted dehydrogenase
MQPVRWGIISTASIGVHKVIPGMLKSSALEVSAIASRDQVRARRAADTLGIPMAYGTYEELLADPSIEAVYNPLPNDLHVPMTLAAARAGKHVLCEKPMSMTAAELEVLRPYAERVHIREAFMVRFHPQWIDVREHVRRGAIGDLRYAQVPFSYHNVDPTDIRNRPENGGGAVYDIGCYAIAAGRWFFEGEPERVAATIDRDPAFGTDRMTSGVLDFGSGRHLTFAVSTQSAPYQRIQLVGTKGRIEIEIPFNAPQDRGCRYWIDDGGGARLVELAVADQYQLQAEAFSQAVRSEQPSSAGLDEAVAQMRVIDAVFEAAATGHFVDVG